MGELIEGSTGGGAGNKPCIFCGNNHKKKKEEELPEAEFGRKDNALIKAGRAFIKGEESRAKCYPKKEDGSFMSPLVAPTWPAEQIFKTYVRSGQRRNRAAKYQTPPEHGYIAAPHHMISICSMNGAKKLPGKPRVNPWASKAEYDINGGGNCMFLPSSASQFYVCYYYEKVKKTGRALQGHLGGHRKIYFETVWDLLNIVAENGNAAGWCEDTESEDKKQEIANEVKKELKMTETFLFRNLAARQPSKEFRLNAKKYIEIPNEDVDFDTPPDVERSLKKPYETLPELDTN